jgi:Carboxypeptidase regulatory-like domain/TonB dependent receptor
VDFIRTFATFRYRPPDAFPILGTCLAIVLVSSVLFSQGSFGRILGTITDQTGAVIPGVTVTIRDVDRGTSRTLTTDEAGLYNAPNLLPGTYTIRVELGGFATVERPNVKLEVGQDIRVDVALRPGQQTELVTVQAESPLVETNNAELGGTIANAVINDLPLNGRNFENLLDLRPGVSKYPGNSGWTNSTNGGRPHDNYFMVEGINSNDPWMAQSMMNAVMAAGDAGTMLPIDAIDEFKTQQNPGGEYGWKPGAVVNVGVKSGTNMIHGTAYAYGRNSAWDARNFFEQAGTPKVPVELEQFGGSLGGPIKQDKLFYFLNFEQQRYSVGNAVQHLVPITAAGVGSAAQNLISACNAVRATGPVAALSAQLAGLATDCTPLANFPGLFPKNAGPTLAFNTSITSENQINSGLGKADFHLNSKHSFSGMYFVSPGNGVFVDNPTAQIAQPWLTNQYARSQVISGNWTWVASNNVVNSLRAGYSRYYQVFQSVDHTQDPANYSYNGSTYHIYTGQTNSDYFGLPTLTIQGFSFQMGLGWPKTVGPDGVYQFTDMVSILHGKHAVKFGGEILVNQSTNNVTANTKGPVRFGNLQSFFSGNMNRASFTAGDFLRHLQNEGYGFYVQDDWRATPKLTVNLGVRYELNTVVKESNNLIGNFDPSVGLVQVGKQIGSVYNGNHNKFAPRVGLAWDISGNGRTVIRAGGGIYFEQGSFDSLMALGNLLGLRTLPTGVNFYTNGSQTPTNAGGTINLGAIVFTGAALGAPNAPGTVKYNWLNNSANTPVYSASPTCGDGTVTLPSGLRPQPCTIMGVDRNLRTPYVSKWNLDFQHAITNNLSIDIAYVGNHGTKLAGLIDINQPQPVGGFSPGWGNPAIPTSPAGKCIASAPTGFDNCGLNPNTGPDTAAEQAARPFASRFPYLSYIAWLSNNNVSNYHGLQASMTQRTSHGLSFVLGYTFAHALSMSSDNWSFTSPINASNVRDIYGPSVFDVRHRFTYSTTYAIPGIKAPAQLLQGWSVNSIVSIQSGLPWGINDNTTDFSGTAEINGQGSTGERWNFFGNPDDFKTTKALLNTNGGIGGIPYFPRTSNANCLAKAQAAGPLGVASLTNLGCYALGNSILVPPAYGSYGTVGARVFRSMPYYNWDLSVTKAWKFQERVTAQFRAEFFNVINHPNISNPFGGPGGGSTYTDPSGTGGASFGFRPETPDVTSSNPVLGSGGPRAIQLGLKIIF